MIEAKQVEVDFDANPDDTFVNLLWIRDESVHRTDAGFTKGNGWEISMIVHGDKPKTHVTFESGPMMKSGAWMIDNTNTKQMLGGNMVVFHLDLSEPAPRASDIEFIPSRYATGQISIADQIVFEAMWPRFVKLLKLRMPGYRERVLKL